MNLESLQDYVLKKITSLSIPIKGSPSLALRPNFLLYISNLKTSPVDFSKMEKLNISYLSFEETSPLDALLSYLKKTQAGAYVSSNFLNDDFHKTYSNVTISLIDPHFLDEIEKDCSQKRIGVLIRKKILACQDFQIEITLS